MNNSIEGMIIKQGRTEIIISEQSDCIAIIRRVWNPHTSSTETTPMLLNKDTFVAMFNPMAEAVNFSK